MTTACHMGPEWNPGVEKRHQLKTKEIWIKCGFSWIIMHEH
jgi:hypothetical protein